MLSAKKELFTSAGGGYQISRSVRLRSSASAYFNRTPASAGNRKTWTWSAWVKRGVFGNDEPLFSGGTSDPITTIRFSGEGAASPDGLRVFHYAGAFQFDLTTTAQYRDPSAWYHIVVACDTPQATATNRLKLYVNGVQVTAFDTATYPSQNYDTSISNNVLQTIGRNGNGSNYFGGYLTEINFIDGQALTPSSFGETNAITGVWQPKKYGGTYGTNGFYLNFSDNSGATATTIGKDYSGNGNNWTPNNISVTAGVTYDSMLDVPTPYDDTGNGRGNYAVMNPLDAFASAYTFADGNLKVTFNSGTWRTCIASMRVTSGKFYWEATFTSISGAGGYSVGVGNESTATANNPFTVGNGAFIYEGIQGFVFNNGTQVGTVATATTNDIMGLALDADAKTLAIYKNNSLLYTITGLTGNLFVPILADSATGGSHTTINFGQRPFSYTPPTGFKALNTQNLPDATIKNGATSFAATTYTGTGSALTIANTVGSASFQPDLVWVKGRSGATDHAWYDAVRGVQKQLESNTTTAETTETTGLTAFGSTGFTVGALAQMNTNAATYVGWQWNAGGTTVTNTSGTISAQVRANTTAGFSVVTWTGTTASSATIGHGLGVAPSMIIVKNRSRASTLWCVYTSTTGNTKALNLNDTSTGITDIGFWNNTNPTSTVFTTGNGYAYYVGGIADNYVAYCFAAVAGYSAFGSYTGNGSADGPFVFTGFRPRWVMIKRTDANENWQVYDTSRNTSNVVGEYLLPNSSSAGATITVLDILSNGFKIRIDSTNPGVNTSGGTYVYACFAENPFKLSLAR